MDIIWDNSYGFMDIGSLCSVAGNLDSINDE